jgi:hypothetical protein
VVRRKVRTRRVEPSSFASKGSDEEGSTLLVVSRRQERTRRGGPSSLCRVERYEWGRVLGDVDEVRDLKLDSSSDVT